MIPKQSLSSSPVRSRQDKPQNRERTRYTADFEYGPVALSDPTLGLLHQVWVARTPAGNTIEVFPEGSPGTPTTLVTDSGITEVSLAFDQNGRTQLVYVANGVSKLYWYDSQQSAFTTTAFPGMTSPVLCHDDKRASQITAGNSDVLLLYINAAGALCYRQQRDRYGVEYVLTPSPPSGRIARYGLTPGLRLQIEFEPTT